MPADTCPPRTCHGCTHDYLSGNDRMCRLVDALWGGAEREHSEALMDWIAEHCDDTGVPFEDATPCPGFEEANDAR